MLHMIKLPISKLFQNNDGPAAYKELKGSLG